MVTEQQQAMLAGLVSSIVVLPRCIYADRPRSKPMRSPESCPVC